MFKKSFYTDKTVWFYLLNFNGRQTLFFSIFANVQINCNVISQCNLLFESSTSSNILSIFASIFRNFLSICLRALMIRSRVKYLF